MAHNNTNFENQHKPSASDKYAFRYTGGNMYLPDIKRSIKMGTAKVVLFLADIFGLTSLFLGWINGMDTFKTIVLFILGVIYASMRIYFYWKKSNQELRKNQLDILEKERNLEI